MLQDFREGIRGIAVWLVIVIAIPFVFFGIDSFFGGRGAPDEGITVNGDSISAAEIERAVAVRKQNLLAQMPGTDPSVLESLQLREWAQQELIREKLLEQAAKSNAITVSPQTVAEILRNDPAFQTDGHFDRQKYEFLLRQMGYTPQSYNALIKGRIHAAQLANGIATTGFATAMEAKTLVELADQKRDFAYLVLPVEPVRQQMVVSDQEIAAYYDGHQTAFQTQETVVIDYIELKPEDVMEGIDISDAEIRQRYAADSASAPAERRRVAHILVAPAADGSQQRKLEEIRGRLAAGEDFAQLARRYSDDGGSAPAGGDLGLLEPAAFPEAFERVANALQVNQVSEPVETTSGVHLIKLLALEKTERPSLQADRARIELELRRQRVAERIPEVVNQLKELSYNAENLADVAKTLQLSAQTSAPFTRRGGEGVAVYPEVVTAAFSDDVLESGYASDALELPNAHVVVVKLREHRPAAVQPLSEVRDQIRDRLQRDKAQAALKERSRTLAERLRSGQPLESLARDEHLEWKRASAAKRFSDERNSEALDAAFEVPAASELPAVRSTIAANGDHLVIAVTAITPGESTGVDVEERRQFDLAAVRAIAGREYQAYESSLRARAKVVSKK